MVPGKAGACPLAPDPLAPEVVFVELEAIAAKVVFVALPTELIAYNIRMSMVVIITMITSISIIDIFYRYVYCYVLLMSTNSKAAINIATSISITSDCPLSSSKSLGV